MASSPPLLTTDEEDEYTNSGKSNFQRAYVKGGVVTSPKGTRKEKDGVFSRLSGRALDNQKKINVKLEDKIAVLKIKLQNEVQNRLDQERKLHTIVKDCNKIQLGNGNTMKILEYDPDREDPIPLLKQLMQINREAHDEIVQKFTISESKLEKNSKYLQKIHSVVLQLRETRSPSTEHQKMEQLKEMVEIPTENDDFSSLEKAFEGLKVDEGTNSFADLNDGAKRGIRIILYKFGSITRQAFANELGLRLEKQHRAGEESLDEDSCASIILGWLKKHDNYVPELLDILKGIENQLIRASMGEHKEQTFAKCCDTGRDVHVQPVISKPIFLQRKRQIGDSVLSLKSNRSDVSETFERYASETIQKAADFPDVRPDTDAYLSAIYMLLMDNTRTLNTIDEKVSSTDDKVNVVRASKNDPAEDETNGSTKDVEIGEDEESEKYV
ncbi:uncharacterized protein LOC123546535 isoform X2 [Mercenaria mercenaria]|nr:uncharacterized protein LOC123546535 isoform X2 [Mercenaria mercenaria]